MTRCHWFAEVKYLKKNPPCPTNMGVVPCRQWFLASSGRGRNGPGNFPETRRPALTRDQPSLWAAAPSDPRAGTEGQGTARGRWALGSRLAGSSQPLPDFELPSLWAGVCSRESQANLGSPLMSKPGQVLVLSWGPHLSPEDRTGPSKAYDEGHV